MFRRLELEKQREMINKEITDVKSLLKQRATTLTFLKHGSPSSFGKFTSDLKGLLEKKSEIDILIASLECPPLTPSIRILKEVKVEPNLPELNTPHCHSPRGFFSRITHFPGDDGERCLEQNKVPKEGDTPPVDSDSEPDCEADYESDDLLFPMELTSCS